MSPAVLTVAGSDSGGGAGIQADLKTFAALEIHGVSAIAAITAQSPKEVREVFVIPPEIVRAQMEAVLDDFDVRAMKTGMLWSAQTIEVVASVIGSRGLRAVVDPVMVSTSGRSLMEEGALDRVASVLMPAAYLLTPNLDEARALLGDGPRDADEMEQAARRLIARGARNVLVKGGHLPGAPIDVLVTEEGRRHRFEGERIEARTHGTGCTYSAAIAALLARGADLVEAVQSAHAFVRGAIAAAAG
jgi:hydroxymethylpyrimidine/phosphomethylpyrimidine kinase